MEKNFEFTTKDDRAKEESDYHKRRRAFIIYNGEVFFVKKGEDKSHYEFALELGIDKETFSTLCRGYYLDGELVFYKGNFVYDDELVSFAKDYIKVIKEKLNLGEFKVYFGLNVGQVGEMWRPKFELKDF